MTKNLRGSACRFLFLPPRTTSFSQYSNLQIPVTTEALNSYSYISQLNKNALCTWAHLLAPQSGKVSSVRQGAHDAAFSSPGIQSHSSCYLHLKTVALCILPSSIVIRGGKVSLKPVLVGLKISLLTLI